MALADHLDVVATVLLCLLSTFIPRRTIKACLFLRSSARTDPAAVHRDYSNPRAIRTCLSRMPGVQLYKNTAPGMKLSWGL